MLPAERIINQIRAEIDQVVANTDTGKELWSLLVKQHPADIASLLTKLSEKQMFPLFSNLPENIIAHVFEKMAQSTQALLLSKLDAEVTGNILKKVHTDKLTDLFEHLSDDDLKKYLKLLQKKQRALIISHLNFAPQSAGRIMNSDVLSLQKDFSVKKSVDILQRTGPKIDLLRRIYVTDKDNILCGVITIEQLVLSKPDMLLKDIMSKNILQVTTDEDQEEVAHKMNHYDLSSAPVVDHHNNFLGVITADDIFEILKEEASEDAYKMSSIAPLEYSYFDTSTWTLLKLRFLWLAGLLLLQSVSSFIVESYQDTIKTHVIISFFITMLIGTGGNAGNQSATLVIRGLATGEIKRKHGLQVFLRELGIGVIMAALLVFVSVIRVYLSHHDMTSALAIGLSLFLIVITAMGLGTLIPLLLERFNIDPAHSAAPFLATLIDILGMLIYCLVASKILG